MKSVSPEDLVTVVAKLRDINERFALVGGCALPFLMDDAFAAVVRPTMDVDVVVEVSTRLGYSKLEARLRELGFQHDTRVGAPRCRWLVDEITVDVMPTSPNAAEFGSRWFEEGLKRPESHTLAGGLVVAVLGPGHLLATKLDAFFSRGEGDYYGSRDLEDVVALMEGCSRLVGELRISSDDLQNHVSERMRRLLTTPAFIEVLPFHLSPESPAGTVDKVMKVAREIAGN